MSRSAASSSQSSPQASLPAAGPAPADPAFESPEAACAAKPLRADAQRNRDTLVETAAALFEQRGIETPLDEIARQAKVGIGTLYRHFPTRDALVAAVYRREVDLLCTGVDELIATHDAEDALASWMRSFAVYAARKRGMAVALKSMVGADSELFAQSRQSIQDAITALVVAATSAGRIRADVDPMDVLRALSGICMATDQPGAGEQTARIVDLLLDGMRYGAPNPAGVPAAAPA